MRPPRPYKLGARVHLGAFIKRGLDIRTNIFNRHIHHLYKCVDHQVKLLLNQFEINGSLKLGILSSSVSLYLFAILFVCSSDDKLHH